MEKSPYGALMAAVSMLALSAGFTEARAQEAAESEEIVVTGFRASLADALTTKRESTLIIESVTAEDIGEFPDQNVAESLQRLPGIQIDRQNGQGTRVRIRGLDQNVVVLNDEIFLSGFELFRLGEGNETQTNSLEGVPSDLIGGIDVYKSPSADLLEGGLGGIVNLRTRRADSIDDYLLSLEIRGNQGEEGDANPTGSIVGGWRFNDRLAVLASVSYDKSDSQHDALGGDNRGGWEFFDQPLSDSTTADVWSPEYRYATLRDQERERLGASLNINFQVTPSLEMNFDWVHSDIDILTSEASLKFPFATENGVYDASDFQVDGNGVFLGGSLTANSAEGISFVQNAESTTDNFQLNFDWDNGGPLTGRFGVYYSMAEYNSISGNNDVRYTQYTVRNGTPGGFIPNPTAPTTFTFHYQNGADPTFTPANPEQFNTPAMVFAKSHWVFGESSELENTAVRADFNWDPPFGDNAGLEIRFGARYAERTVDSEFGRYLADYSGLGEIDATALGVGDWTPYGYFQDGAIGFKYCDLLGAGTPGLPPGLAPCTGRFGDSPALITPYQTAASNPERFETLTVGGIQALFQNRDQMSNPVAWIQSLYPNTPFRYFQDPLNTFVVEEKTKIGYVEADVGEPSDGFHLNAGVRFVATELNVQSAGTPTTPLYWGTDSWNGVLRNPTPLSTSREYVDILPSFNAVFDISDQDKVRVSAARVVARQNLFNLGQGSQFNFTRVNTPGPDLDKFEFTGGNGGNPELDPFRANQFDVTWERYFGEQGLLSVGLFYKSVDSFIQNDTVSRFVPDETEDGGTFGGFSQPTNGEGGKIRGVELSAQYAFDNGFGFTANYTYSNSETAASNDFDDDLPIPGVSEHAYNVTGYYENGPFAGRLSYAWRDDFFVGNFGFATSVLGRYQRAYGQLDGQLSFDVTPAFQVTLEGINLTEEDTEEYLQFENLPFRHLSGERRFVFGGRYRFGE
ncbi:MAG: TonB-dependent receptor [Hyphomonadaceae bacterium]|nr:TonB-dependent receptor [Hyphomonadaceae bacterium]